MIHLPDNFPLTTQVPRFQLGDRVSFVPLPAADYGIVVGLQFAPAKHLQDWSWRYTIWLDSPSPSRAWTASDLAWEEDLELLAAVTAPSTEQPA